jgi:oligopeptide/dipeptide ABC transporter ATP-binding protein
MNDVVLRVSGLTKYFPLHRSLFSTLSSKGREYVRAVDDISFEVRRNEILGFVGESGCGKSTMSRTILRLIEPSGGEIIYEGTKLTALNRRQLKAARRKMQMIFQDPHGSLNPRRTVADILRQTIKIHELASGESEENELIRNTLEEVELRPPESFWDRYPDLLSGGQRQRVGIGRVLILEPKLLVADEPISMLDVSVRIGILDLLLKMREKHGISFIYITHDLATARYICDRIAIMYLGKIVEIAPTEDILSNSIHPYTRALIEAVPVTDPTVKIHEVPIKGYVPMIPEDFKGCRFRPRCLYAVDRCRETEPDLIEVKPNHLVACPIRAEKLL